ncbi:MAG: hypothetical protein AAGI17_00025 [Planctomycetota bacterium]
MDAPPEQPRPREHRPLGPVASWCFAAAGLAIIASVLLIDAQADLLVAEYERDRAIAAERTHVDRLEKHRTMLAALESGEPAAVRAMQIHLYGQNRLVENPLPGRATEPELVLAWSLEPSPPEMPTEPTLDSTLARLATGQRTRLWVALVGALALLFGLLPTFGDANDPG